MVKRKMKTKNVKIKKVLAIVAVLTVMLLTFVACSTTQTAEPNFQQFVIKFYLNESDETPYATIKVDKKDFDFEQNLPQEPTKPDVSEGKWKFLGWFYSDGTIFDFEKLTKNEDINLYAKFELIKNSFTVMFQDEDGTPIKVNGKTTQEVNYGDSAIEPKRPTKEGYTFAGWDKDFTNITKDVTIKATYTVNEYTVTYKSLGEVVSTSKVKFGTSISDTTPDVSELGLSFIGFFDENGEQITNMPARDITLVAKWKIQEISKIELTQNVDKVVYGDALPTYTLTFDKVKNPKITYKIEWQINGEKVEGETTTFVPQNKIVGKYNVKAKIIASVEGLESVEAYSSSLAYYVNKATLTVNVNSATIIYGDDLPRFTYTIEGYKYGEDESVLAGAFSVKTDYKKGLGVGNYIVNGDGLLASNYEIRYNSVMLTVTKKPLDVTIDSQNVTYGNDLAEITCVVNGLIDGDSKQELGVAEFETEYKRYDGVGTYLLKFKQGFAFNGEKAVNYEITLKNAIVTVEKREVEVTINKVDDVTYLGEIPMFSISSNGLVSGDTISDLGVVEITTDYTPGADVGEYEVVATFTKEGNNYKPIVKGNERFSVLPKSVDFTGSAEKDNETDTSLWSGDMANYVKLPSGFVIDGTLQINTNETGEYVINGELTKEFTANYVIKKDGVDKTKNFNIVYDFKLSIGKFIGVKIDTFVGDYDGQPHGSEVVVMADGMQNVIVEYSEDNAKWQETSPTYVDSGEYLVYYRLLQDGKVIQTNSYKIVINKISNTISFSADEYTYNGKEQTITGNVVANENPIVRYENNKFTDVPTSGKTTITVIVEETKNYKQTAKNFEVKINKANYENLVLDTFEVFVEPNKTLKDSKAPKFVTFVDDSYVPVLGEQQVSVVYLDDEMNYNPLTTTLTVVGKKTQIEIVSGDYEINYGEQLTVEVTYKKDGEPFNYDGLSVTPSRTTFDVGSTYIVTLTLDENDFYDATEKEVVVKVKSVSYNGVLYTIEDALKLNTAKTGTATVNDYLIITANTSFATSEVKAKRPDVYFGEQYYTLSENEYLLVPFSSAHEIKADIVEQAIAGTSKNSAYATLTLPSGTNVESYGHILVNAVRAGGAGVSGNPSGNKYGAIQIRDNATLTINGGVFETLGFVHGQGKVVVKSGNVYETMSLLNFKGGSVTFKIYKDIFPVNQFTLSNIMVDMEICQGVNYFAKAYIYARMEVQSDVKFIGSTKEEFIQLKSGKIIKTFDETTGKMTLNMYGNIQLNDMAIRMPGIFGTLEVSTNGKQVPLSGYVDIVAKTGSIIDIGVGIKLLPGAEFTIEKGATVNLNKGGNLFVYSNDENMKIDKSSNPKNTPVFDGYQDGQWQYPTTSQDAWFNNIKVTFTSKTPAVIIVEGTLNVKSGSAIAGMLTAKEGGIVIVEDGANLTHSIKEDFTLSSGLGTTKNFFTSTSSASGLLGGVLTKFEVGTYTGTKEGWVKG